MWTFKFIAVICAVLAICQANPLLTRNGDSNIIHCPDPSGPLTLLEKVTVYESPDFLQSKKWTFRFPSENVNNIKITCIIIQNMATDGTGVYPEIIAGGLGQDYIEIVFRSQIGKHMNFIVELYGKSSP